MYDKTLMVYLVLDTSASMYGEPIEALNAGIPPLVEALAQRTAEKGVRLRLGILEFNTSARWLTSGPANTVAVDDFCWKPLSAGGMTSMGEAVRQLDSALRQIRQASGMAPLCRPVVVFLTDGYPTDDWDAAFSSTLRNNHWYRNALKLGIAFRYADVQMLKKLLNPDDREELCDESESSDGAVFRASDCALFDTVDPDRMVQVLSNNTVAMSLVSASHAPVLPPDYRNYTII